jgi:hypothetical protein
MILRQRPFLVRLWNHYRGFRRIDISVIASASGALRCSVMRNPVIDATKISPTALIIFAGFAGLLTGVLIGWVIVEVLP